MKHSIHKSMAALALSQSIMDRLHAPQVDPNAQETAQPSPQMETPQPTPEPVPAQPTPEPTPKQPQPAADSLEAEANSVKDLENTLSNGFEAVSKLADAMKEVTGVKKSITKRIREKLNGEQKPKETVA